MRDAGAGSETAVERAPMPFVVKPQGTADLNVLGNSEFSRGRIPTLPGATGVQLFSSPFATSAPGQDPTKAASLTTLFLELKF